MAKKGLRWFHWLASVLIAIALLNWGTVAWINFNIVEWLTFGISWLETTIYTIVALFGLFGLTGIIMKALK